MIAWIDAGADEFIRSFLQVAMTLALVACVLAAVIAVGRACGWRV